MPRAQILRSALKDLDDIWLYVARYNERAAQRLIDRIESTAQTLARFPGIGRDRSDLEPGVRSFPVGKYLVFYRRIRGGIEIIHVVHGARGLGGLFQKRREDPS